MLSSITLTGSPPSGVELLIDGPQHDVAGNQRPAGATAGTRLVHLERQRKPLDDVVPDVQAAAVVVKSRRLPPREIEGRGDDARNGRADARRRPERPAPAAEAPCPGLAPRPDECWGR